MTPPIIVHSPREVAAAIAAGASTIQTPPGGTRSLGVGYLWQMTSPARKVGIKVIVDCGSHAGDAQAALAIGFTQLHFTGTPEAAHRLQAISSRLCG